MADGPEAAPVTSDRRVEHRVLESLASQLISSFTEICTKPHAPSLIWRFFAGVALVIGAFRECSGQTASIRRDQRILRPSIAFSPSGEILEDVLRFEMTQ
jgi:hypothetical protein